MEGTRLDWTIMMVISGLAILSLWLLGRWMDVRDVHGDIQAEAHTLLLLLLLLLTSSSK